MSIKNLKFTKGWQVWVIRDSKDRKIKRYYGKNFQLNKTGGKN